MKETINNQKKPWGMDLNTFCVLMHLSPLFAWPLTLAMWLTNKDDYEIIDLHGKSIANFLISFIIYNFVALFINIPLMFIFIGFFTIYLLPIVGLIFTIIGAIKANEGKIYKYPLTFEFIK
tara:strand:+ start:389 stop:751 length:363 start_codon:yes stop_codon:yes gene_type:complete